MTKNGYLPALDGVRALAVLAVLGYHSRETLLPGGRIGVDVFFVLSGFLITGILLREHEGTGRVSYRRFYLRRVLRLLPALAVVAPLGALAFWLLPGIGDRDGSLLGAAAALTYTSSPLAAAGVDLGSFGHAWSLSVEEYFYVAWPFLLVLLCRGRRTTRLILCVTAAALVYRLGVGFAASWSADRIYYGADTRAVQLLIGCSLAALVAGGAIRVRTWHAVLALVVLGAAMVLPGTDTAYREWLSIVTALAAAVVIALVATRTSSWLTSLLASRPLVWVGRRSYGIYLWNPVIASVTSAVLPHRLPLLPIILVLSLVVPALSFRYVEQPCLRLKGRWESRLAPADRGDAAKALADARPGPRRTRP